MLDDYYAASGIDSAIEHTKSLLWPVNLGIWLRLAVISFFVGGSQGFDIFRYTSQIADPSTTATTGDLDLLFQNPGLVMGIIAGVFLLVVIVGIVGSAFQFVFVDCLSSGKILLSRTFWQRIGKGARLFAFIFGVLLLFIAAFVALLMLIFIPLGETGLNLLTVLAIITGMLLIIVLILLLWLIILFTTDFVVPVMTKEDCGVFKAWGICWQMLWAEWKQAAFYAIARLILTICTGIVIMILMVIALIILGIPFLIAGVMAMALSEVMAAVLLILFVILAIPVSLLISVPFNTFFRYYALDVLGRFSPEYRLLPVADDEE